MKPAACPRLFQAEAMRDGRLLGAELASFERHTTACSACAREVGALEALAEALRALPNDASDELHARRERTRLLSAFNRTLVAPEERWLARRLLLVPAALAVLFVSVFVFWRLRAPEQSKSLPVTVVRGDDTAVWSEHAEHDRKKLRIERGVLWIHVDPSSQAGRLLVELPDGELEDTGTTFTVSVENGRTTRVAVEEGSVVLRIRGQRPVAIASGETWSPDFRPEAPARRSSAPLAEPAPSGARPAAVRAPLPPSPPMPSASALSRDPSVDFRAAMTALNGGANREAAAAFAGFLAKHPRDPRAEDAAYLRIIALQRSGDNGAMKDAARSYLRSYPKGFRRAEAENLSR